MGQHSFAPALALNRTDVEKFEVGKKLTGWGRNWLVIFFFCGKNWLVSFFPGEEMGQPDPSSGKNWRGEKTDGYTGFETSRGSILFRFAKFFENLRKRQQEGIFAWVGNGSIFCMYKIQYQNAVALGASSWEWAGWFPFPDYRYWWLADIVHFFSMLTRFGNHLQLIICEF